jgi:hypothetical protein
MVKRLPRKAFPWRTIKVFFRPVWRVMSSKKISFLWKDKKRRNLVYRGCKEQVFPTALASSKIKYF